MFLLQKKARNKRDYVRKNDYEVVPGNQINGTPSIKRRKPNLDASMILQQLNAEDQ